MNQFLARILIAVLLIGSMIGGTPVFGVGGFYYAIDAHHVTHYTVHIAGSLNVSENDTGTVHYAVTTIDCPTFTPEALAAGNINHSKVIQQGHLLQVEQGMFQEPVQLPIETPSGFYKVQAAAETYGTLYPAQYDGRFFFNRPSPWGLNASVVETSLHGFTIEVNSEMPGMVYAAVFIEGTGSGVTYDQIMSGSGSFVTNGSPIVTGSPASISLESNYLQPNTAYDISILYRDLYNNTSYFDYMTLGSVKTAGVQLIQASYDNGALAAGGDDFVSLEFSDSVSTLGSAAGIQLMFDNSDPQLDDVELVGGVEFSYSVDMPAKTMVLSLNSSGRNRLAEMFVEGNMVVTLNPANVVPSMVTDANSLTVPISLAEINAPDRLRLSRATYSYTNEDPILTGDLIELVFAEEAMITDAGVSGDYSIQIDKVTTNGYFEQADVTLQPEDYEIVLLEGSVSLSLNESAEAKLQGLDRSAWQVQIIHPENIEPGGVDPYGAITWMTVLSPENRLNQVYFRENSIPGFEPNTLEYLNVPVVLNSDGELFGPDQTPFFRLDRKSTASIGYLNWASQGMQHTIYVKSQSGFVRLYQIYLTLDVCEMATILVDQAPLADFSKYEKHYVVQLPPNTSVMPVVSGIPEVNQSVVTTSVVGSLPGTCTVTLTVTNTETDPMQTAVYTVQFQSEGSQAPISESGEEKSAELLPAEPPPYYDPAVPNAPPPDMTPEQIDQITNALNAEGASNVAAASTEQVAGQLERLNQLLVDADTYTDTQLFRTLIKLDNAVEAVNQVLETPGTDASEIVLQLEQMTQAVESKLFQLENPVDALTVAEQFVGSLADFKSSSQVSSAAMDQTVENMINTINERLGTVKIAGPDQSGQPVVIESDTVQKAIDRQVQFSTQIETLSNQFFGENDVRRTVTSVVLAFERSQGMNELQTLLKPEIVNQIQSNQIEAVSMAVGGSKISIPTSQVSSASELVIRMTFKTNQTLGAPGGDSEGFKASDTVPIQVVSFNVIENGIEKDSYAQPVELKFDLKEFNLTAQEGASAGIYKLNEATGGWQVVGGRVDFQLGIIFVKRSSLSQYTVMKSKKSFSDSDTSWAKNEINALLNKGIVETANAFQPKALLTRAEFASWIAKAYGLVPTTNQSVPFTDIDKTNPNYNAVLAVYQMGIIAGKSKRSFDPNGNITSDEMAVIIGKTLVLLDNKQASGKVQSKHLSALKQKSTASWAEGEQALLMELGIASGEAFAKGDGFITKETAAATFMKFYNS